MPQQGCGRTPATSQRNSSWTERISLPNGSVPDPRKNRPFRTSPASAWPSTLSMQNWPQSGLPSRSPHCGQAVEPHGAVGLDVRDGLQLLAHAQVLVQPGRAHRARRQAGHAGELDHVLGRASASTRLNSGAASLSRVTAKGVPSWTAAAPSDCSRRMSSRLRMPPAAISGTSRSSPASRSRCGHLRQHHVEIEARVVHVGDPRGAEVAAGVAGMLDHDGVGQAALLRSHLRTTSCTPRASDRMGISPTLRVVRRQVGQVQRQPGADHDRVDAAFQRLRDVAGVLAHRAHHVDGQQAAALRPARARGGSRAPAPRGWPR